MKDLQRMSVSSCAKVFLHRDFSDGMGVKFPTQLPAELEGKIDANTFATTITTINSHFTAAESLGGRTYCESCMACVTAYMLYLCINTHYEKNLEKIARYIEEQNKNVYNPRGISLVDPSERGLRVIEICLLETPFAHQ